MTTEIILVRFYCAVGGSAQKTYLSLFEGSKNALKSSNFSSHFIINSRQPFICRFMSSAVTSKGGAAYFHAFALLCAVGSAEVPITTAETSDPEGLSHLTDSQEFQGSLILNMNRFMLLVHLRNRHHI